MGQVDHEDEEAATKGGRRPARLFVSPPAELEPHLDGISLVALGQVRASSLHTSFASPGPEFHFTTRKVLTGCEFVRVRVRVKVRFRVRFRAKVRVRARGPDPG